MKLETITITNFRCFESLNIRFEPDVTLFVGVNGAGKTAILDAIAIALHEVVAIYVQKPPAENKDIRLLPGDIYIPPGEGQLPERRRDFVQVFAAANRLHPTDFFPPTVETPEQRRVEWQTRIDFTAPVRYTTTQAADAMISGYLKSLWDIYHHNPHATDPLPVVAYYRAGRKLTGGNEGGDIFSANLDRPAAFVDALDAGIDYDEMCLWLYLTENEDLRSRNGARSRAGQVIAAVKQALRLALDNVIDFEFRGVQYVKHCLKSQPDPPGLKDYRDTNPEAEWDTFKNADPAAYKQLRDRIHDDQRSLCAYCELRLSENNYQVAHFHPKSDRSTGTNWALDWNNLWLCCMGGTRTWLTDPQEYTPLLPENRSCDEHKESQILDDVIMRPGDVPAFPRIFAYNQQPNAILIHEDAANCESAGINPQQAEDTVCRLHLNCPRLRIARLQVLRSLEREIAAARKQGVKDIGSTHLPAKWLSRGEGAGCRSFFTMIRWRLGLAAESYLAEAGYTG